MKIIVAVIVGLACLNAAARASAPAYGELNEDLLTGVNKTMKDARATKVGYNPVKDPNGKPSQALEWVSIPGGQFTLGASNFSDAKPIDGKIYTIKTFEASKTLVTVEQYAECVIKGECTNPDTTKYCNYYKPGRRLHPVNCVDWHQANQYAKFKDGRLLTETEYDYAATSGGKNYKYPWGNEEATCERAVIFGNGDYGCGSGGTMRVCSKDAGNTKIEGLSADKQLCDMVGNVWQWVQDKYQNTYADTPTDGSASEDSDSDRVLRGGPFRATTAGNPQAVHRRNGDPAGRNGRSGSVGFRLARSSH